MEINNGLVIALVIFGAFAFLAGGLASLALKR